MSKMKEGDGFRVVLMLLIGALSLTAAIYYFAYWWTGTPFFGTGFLVLCFVATRNAARWFWGRE